jgi:hypothetical protein
MTNIPFFFTIDLRRQRGAGSLVVVAILLVVLSVAVIFGNKTILFEQKTSTNQYRSTLAFEAADAGLSWATAMLNKQEYINANCATDTSTSVRFKNKYINVDATTGALSPINSGSVVAACAYNLTGGALTCNCPAAGTAPTAAAPTGSTGYTPGFAVALITNSVTGTVDLVSYGCSAVINSTTCSGDAGAKVSITLGQASGLSTPPASPLTARGSVSVGNAALGVINPDPNTNGVTINAGGSIDAPNARISTIPGTPPFSTLVGNDGSLRNLTEDSMFATYFGMSKDAYKSLPATTVLSCSGACTGTDLQNAYNSGARQIWIPGDLNMSANATIGSGTDPFVLVVDGAISISGTVQLYAVIYSTAVTWNDTGGGSALLRGAAISEGSFTGNGTPDYYYDPDVMRRIRNSASSFVAVPGSWKDF